MSDKKQIGKQASHWTTEELILWAKDEVSPHGQSSNRTVAEEAVARFGLEASTDVAYVKKQILAETQTAPSAAAEEPADETANGEEVESGETGDEPAEPTPEPEAEVVEPVPASEIEDPEPVVLPQAKPTAVPSEVKPTKSQTEMKIEIIEQNLSDFARKMGTNVQVTAAEGAVSQGVLYRTIKMVLAQEGGDFTNMYGRLLGFVKTHRNTMFSDRYAYRFFDQVRINQADRKNFERILNLMIATCDPATRRLGLSQVDLQGTLAGFRDGNIQQRVTEYYQV